MACIPATAFPCGLERVWPAYQQQPPCGLEMVWLTSFQRCLHPSNSIPLWLGEGVACITATSFPGGLERVWPASQQQPPVDWRLGGWPVFRGACIPATAFPVAWRGCGLHPSNSIPLWLGEGVACITATSFPGGLERVWPASQQQPPCGLEMVWLTSF